MKFDEMASLITESPTKNMETLTRSERTALSNQFHKNPILTGNKYVDSMGEAISAVSVALDAEGFVLDMVTDLDSSSLSRQPKGTRTLPFRRKHAKDGYEHPEISNSRVAFAWYNTVTSGAEYPGDEGYRAPSYEIVAYVS